MSITQPLAGDRIIVSKLLNLQLHGCSTGGGEGAITWYDSVGMLTIAPLCDDCFIRPQFTHAKLSAI